jgi:N-acetylmuramoyl-L-alanine amidase
MANKHGIVMQFLRWFCCLTAFISISAWATQIHNIEVSPSSSSHFEIIFQLKSDASYNYFLLPKPDRLVIDFYKTTLNTNLKTISFSGTSITKVRSGAPKAGVLRIVLDLSQPIKVKASDVIYKSNGEKRIIFAMEQKSFALTASSPILKTKTPPTQYQPIQPTISLPNKSGYRDVVVLIDPGHGGKDPGAIGPGHTQEKDIVLAIALELYELVNKEPGMKARMTRSGNYYVTLRDRLTKARTYKADVFVSIHADAFKHMRSRGASVYALSLKGASSEAARWLAEKENYSELGGVNLSDKNDVLRSVLLDLSQTATISASLELGQGILRQIGDVTRLHYSRVEQAPFVVLKSPDIPSILVETGFLSNPSEEKNLRDPFYQRQLARAILKGIKDYFYLKPPPETKISAQHLRPSYYVAVRGDSLDSIADRFNISVSALKRANHLSHSGVNVGQVLSIPVG